MKRQIVTATVLAMLVGCGLTEPDTELKTSSPKARAAVETAARFEIERVGVFKDDLAYMGKRGIYILRDSQTGRHFVGVSGIGISELGSHDSGDVNSHQVPDER